VAGLYASAWLARSIRRESNPNAEEEALWFYRRGQKYDAVGGRSEGRRMFFSVVRSRRAITQTTETPPL
jgi:hypothetical protein